MTENLGLLAVLQDPQYRAECDEREALAERMAEQMGCTVTDARRMLVAFAFDTEGVPADMQH